MKNIHNNQSAPVAEYHAQLISTMNTSAIDNAELLLVTLRKMHKKLGTYAFALWAKKMGYKFSYVHKIVTGKEAKTFASYNHNTKSLPKF